MNFADIRALRRAFLPLLILVASPIFCAENLQQIIDAAVERGEKTVKLSGTYFVEKPLELSERHSGLTIDGGGKTAVSGGVKISGWTREGKFLKARVSADKVESLFVNGKRAQRAETELRHVHSAGDSSIAMRNEDVRELLELPREKYPEVLLEFYSVWINAHCRLLDITRNPDGKTATLKVRNPLPIPLSKWDKNPRLRIVNIFSALDKRGKFHFDSREKTVRYYPFDGETPENISAYYPAATRLLSARGKSPEAPLSGLAIRGIAFEHSAHLPPVNWRQNTQAAVGLGGALYFACVENLRFESNTVRHTNTYGLEVGYGSKNVEISQNEFFDNGAGGIKIGADPRAKLAHTQNVKVSDNIVYSYGRHDKAGVGIIYMDASRVLVDHNTVFDGHYSGISGGWTWGYAPTNTRDNKITNNLVFEIGRGLLCDMGGIYTLGSHKNSVISGNEISGVHRHRYGGWGIYNDEGSADFLVEKNFVHDTAEEGYHQHYGKNNTVRNNIFAYGSTAQIALSRLGEKYPDELVFERNVVVYRSPAKILKNDKPVPRLNGKFDYNIYCNENGAVEFAKMPPAVWQNKYGQDKHSLFENSEIKDEKRRSELYEKIGFEPFDTLGAGVRGKMKKRLARIMRTYKISPVEKISVQPEWTRGFTEDLSQIPLGFKPTLPAVSSNNGGFDVAVLADESGRFVRYIDSPQKPTYFPASSYKVSLGRDATALLSFEVRVNKTSSFFVECRGDTGYSGPIFAVKNGTFSPDTRTGNLPHGKWIRVEMSFRAGADKSYRLKISDGAKTLFDERIPQYRASAANSFTEIIVAQTSNVDGAYFDIRNLSFGEIKSKMSK